jgi:hypothetical protein
MGGHEVPYLGYVEVEVAVPDGLTSGLLVPLLVVEDDENNAQVPVLLGTNYFKLEHQRMLDEHGVRYLQKAKLPTPVHLALSTYARYEKFLSKSNGQLGTVRATDTTSLDPGESTILFGKTSMNVQVCHLMAVSETPDSSTFDVVPGLLRLNRKEMTVPVEVHNVTSNRLLIQQDQLCVIYTMYPLRILKLLLKEIL